MTEDGGNREGPGSGSLSFGQKTAVALMLFGLVGLAAWQTMEPGKYQTLTWILLGFFAFRVTLGWLRTR